MSKSDRGKIRYLAGWALFKVINECHGYWKKNEGSKCEGVQRRIKKEKRIQDLATSLTSTQDSVLRTTICPDSIDEIEYNNRAGLTHVSDATYFFFITLELSCSRYFTYDMIASYKWDILKIARELVRADPSIAIAWDNLIYEIKGKP